MLMQMIRLSYVQLYNCWLNLHYPPKTQTNLTHRPSVLTAFYFGNGTSHCVVAQILYRAHGSSVASFVLFEKSCGTAQSMQPKHLCKTWELWSTLQCLQLPLCGGLISCAVTQRFQFSIKRAKAWIKGHHALAFSCGAGSKLKTFIL